MCTSVVAATAALAATCGSSPGPASPVLPTQPPSIDYFVGNWTPFFTTSQSMAGIPVGCSHFEYSVVEIDPNSANVTYDVACGGYAVEGTASGLFQDSVLKWNAKGTVAAGNVNCPFVTDNYATIYRSDQIKDDLIKVFYNLTVCGIGFSGDVLLKHK